MNVLPHAPFDASSDTRPSAGKRVAKILVPIVLFGVLFVYILSKGASSTTFLIFFSVNACVLVGLYVTLTCLKEKIETHYLLVFSIFLVVSGLIVMVMLPPGSVPDEHFHFLHAYQLASSLMGYPLTSTDASGAAQTGIWMRTQDADFALNNLFGYIDYEAYRTTLDALLSSGDSSSMFFPYDKTSSTGNPPQVRVAQVAGIMLAYALNLNAATLFYLGRVFSFALFCVCVILAVKFTPIGKPVFMAVALLPITLQEGMSYSYDGAIIAFSFLLTGLLLRAIYREGRMSTKEYIGIAICAALLAPCKLLYSGIVLLVLFIPSNRFSSKKMSYLAKASFFIIAALAIVACRIPDMLVQTNTVVITNENGEVLTDVGGQLGVTFSFAYLIEHPFKSMQILANTIVGLGDFYIDTGFARTMGSIQANIVSPYWMTIGYIFCLFILLLTDNKKRPNPSFRQKAMFVLIFILGFLAIEYALAVTWSFADQIMISGVQGRYFLPLMPLLLLGLRPTRIKLVEGQSVYLHAKTMFVIAVLNCMVFSYVFYHAIF